MSVGGIRSPFAAVGLVESWSGKRLGTPVWLRLWLALTQAGQEPIGRSQRPRVTLKAVTPAPDAAYEAFITEHQRAILNYLWRMTNDEQCAYDLTQEVFVRAWRHFNKVAGYDNPRGWLFRVATNLALTELAGRKRNLTSVELLTPAQEPASSDPAWRVEQRDTVRAALVALAPRRRAALTLREVYGLSYAEIARALETSEASIRMTVSRAREQFRTLYLQAGGEGHDA